MTDIAPEWKIVGLRVFRVNRSVPATVETKSLRCCSLENYILQQYRYISTFHHPLAEVMVPGVQGGLVWYTAAATLAGQCAWYPTLYGVYYSSIRPLVSFAVCTGERCSVAFQASYASSAALELYNSGINSISY